MQLVILTEMYFKALSLLRDPSVLDRSAVIINNVLANLRQQHLIAKHMSNDTIFDWDTRNRSYPAPLRQLEFIHRTVFQCPVQKFFLYKENIPQEMQHEPLNGFLPFACLDGGRVSPIQVIGVADDLFIIHRHSP
jgi:hypothetical protein